MMFESPIQEALPWIFLLSTLVMVYLIVGKNKK